MLQDARYNVWPSAVQRLIARWTKHRVLHCTVRVFVTICNDSVDHSVGFLHGGSNPALFSFFLALLFRVMKRERLDLVDVAFGLECNTIHLSALGSDELAHQGWKVSSSSDGDLRNN